MGDFNPTPTIRPTLLLAPRAASSGIWLGPEGRPELVRWWDDPVPVLASVPVPLFVVVPVVDPPEEVAAAEGAVLCRAGLDDRDDGRDEVEW